VLKSTAAESHPERHFGCGNRQTLLAKGRNRPTCREENWLGWDDGPD